MASAIVQVIEGQRDSPAGVGQSVVVEGDDRQLLSVVEQGQGPDSGHAVPREGGDDQGQVVHPEESELRGSAVGIGHNTGQSSHAGVSFAAVLADLEEESEAPSGEGAEPSAGSTSVTPEGGNRQTDLSHWLK